MNRIELDKSALTLLPKRDKDGNKGTFGKLIIIAGSKNMAGAAILAGKASFRTGLGMVKIISPECNRVIIQTALPEAILYTYEDKLDKEKLLEELSFGDGILLGPGLGQSELSRELLEFVFVHASIPILIDADGLNLLSKNMSLLTNHPSDLILTPHVGEMARLTNKSIPYIKENSLALAEEFAGKYNLTLVLKDSKTIITDGRQNTYINTYGNSGMATAGSGDVLSGIIMGLLVQGLPYDRAAYLGVLLHALSGDYMADKLTEYSLMASDLIDGIPHVLRDYLN